MLYSYRCKKCDHLFDKRLMMAERKQPESEPCPECGETGHVFQTLTSAPYFGDPVRMGRKKPAAGFNEVLRNIKKGNPGSTVKIHD